MLGFHFFIKSKILVPKEKKKKNRVLAYKEAPNTSSTMIPYVESGLLWVECPLEEHLLAVGEGQG